MWPISQCLSVVTNHAWVPQSLNQSDSETRTRELEAKENTTTTDIKVLYW